MKMLPLRRGPRQGRRWPRSSRAAPGGAAGATGEVGSASEPAAQPTPSRPGYAWDPRILGSRAPQTSGYGVSRRTIRGRARTVRAARHPQGSLSYEVDESSSRAEWPPPPDLEARPVTELVGAALGWLNASARRPIVLVVAGGLAGTVGWLGMNLAALNVINRDFRFAPGDAAGLLFAVVAYLWGIALFSWAWELGDRAKALKLGATIAVVGVAAWLIIVGVAVILVMAASGGSGGSGDSGGDGEGGSGGGAHADGAVDHGGGAADAAPQGLDAWGLARQIAVSEARGRLESAFDRAEDGPDDPQPPEPPVYGDRVVPPRGWRGWRGRRSPRKRVE